MITLYWQPLNGRDDEAILRDHESCRGILAVHHCGSYRFNAFMLREIGNVFSIDIVTRSLPAAKRAAQAFIDKHGTGMFADDTLRFLDRAATP